ncbi:MAG TPA: hypothetical protein VJX92_23750 [Methylomirabilota bacterium]|nr:hypothetical protein [Methylomirabilota bacterium]
MIRKTWMCVLVSLSIVIGVIGLFAFTGESVRHVTEPVRTFADLSQTPGAAPAAEPLMGPVIQPNGLMLTY